MKCSCEREREREKLIVINIARKRERETTREREREKEREGKERIKEKSNREGRKLETEKLLGYRLGKVAMHKDKNYHKTQEVSRLPQSGCIKLQN